MEDQQISIVAPPHESRRNYARLCCHIVASITFIALLALVTGLASWHRASLHAEHQFDIAKNQFHLQLEHCRNENEEKARQDIMKTTTIGCLFDTNSQYYRTVKTALSETIYGGPKLRISHRLDDISYDTAAVNSSYKEHQMISTVSSMYRSGVRLFIGPEHMDYMLPVIDWARTNAADTVFVTPAAGTLSPVQSTVLPKSAEVNRPVLLQLGSLPIQRSAALLKYVHTLHPVVRRILPVVAQTTGTLAQLYHLQDAATMTASAVEVLQAVHYSAHEMSTHSGRSSVRQRVLEATRELGPGNTALLLLTATINELPTILHEWGSAGGLTETVPWLIQSPQNSATLQRLWTTVAGRRTALAVNLTMLMESSDDSGMHLEAPAWTSGSSETLRRTYSGTQLLARLAHAMSVSKAADAPTTLSLLLPSSSNKHTSMATYKIIRVVTLKSAAVHVMFDYGGEGATPASRDHIGWLYAGRVQTTTTATASVTDSEGWHRVPFNGRQRLDQVADGCNDQFLAVTARDPLTGTVIRYSSQDHRRQLPSETLLASAAHPFRVELSCSVDGELRQRYKNSNQLLQLTLQCPASPSPFSTLICVADIFSKTKTAADSAPLDIKNLTRHRMDDISHLEWQRQRRTLVCHSLSFDCATNSHCTGIHGCIDQLTAHLHSWL